MSPRIFFTGATGYVGGPTLSLLTRIFPHASIHALVRTAEKAKIVQVAYPNITCVIGDLDSHDLLMAEAAKADLILHCANADHEAGTLALLNGLASKENDLEKGIFIHVSGAASLIDLDTIDDHLGEPATKNYSDIKDATTIFNLPPDRMHVAIERRVVSIGDANGVKTLILSPAQIMGVGSSIGKKDTYTDEYPKAVLKQGHAFILGQGQNTSSWSSVGDVAAAIAFVVGEALKGSESKLTFGKYGYYFIESGEVIMQDLAAVVAAKLVELDGSQDAELKSIDAAVAMELHPYAKLLWGTSMISRADKLKALGWQSKDEDWRPFILETAERALETWNREHT